MRVHARHHPAAETVFAEFVAGSSISDILGPNANYCRVEIGGRFIAQAHWSRVRPKVGAIVIITGIPRGGVKNALRLIAFAALAVGMVAITGGAAAIAIPGLTGLAGTVGGTTLFAAGSLSAGLLAGGLGLVGSLFINALLPPSQGALGTGSSSVDTLRSITGTGNQIDPFGAVPCVFGEGLVFPKLAAKPYSELLGDDQYIRMLLDLGEGSPVASDWKIGDSDLSTFTDVETETSVSPALFSMNIDEETAGVALNDDGDSSVKTTSSNAIETSVDLSFASGLFGVDGSGNVIGVTCKVKVEYRLSGSGGTYTTVTASTDGLTISNSAAVPDPDGTFHITNAARKAVRVGIRWKVPGQCDIQITRVATDWGSSSDDGKVGDLTWTVIRSVRSGQVSSTGTLKFAVRIKATDQLSGAISNMSCTLGQAGVPVWDTATSTWTPQVTLNPAWNYRWLLTGCPANPKRISVDRVIDDEIKEWAADCEARGLKYFTNVDSVITIAALMDDMCTAGRATKAQRDGRYGVVRDTPQATPVQVFTPRNSWGFQGARAFNDVTHALRVQFTNPDADWQQDERIVYDDGYGDAAMVAADPTLTLATNFDTLTLKSVPDADAAWHLGRYHLAVGRERPNSYSLSAEIDNLVCSRGDLAWIVNDVIQQDVASGRITDLEEDDDGNVTVITIDEGLARQDGGVAVRVRRDDGTFIQTAATLLGDGEFGHVLSLAVAQAGVKRGDLAVYGPAGQEVIPVKIKQIEPAADLEAKLTFVDDAPAVLNADAGTPPPWTSSITGQAQVQAPAPPSTVTVNSSQLLSTSDDGGVTQPVMMVAVTGPWSGISRTGAPTLDHVEVRYRTEDPVGAWTTIALPNGELATTIYGITRGIDYQVEARAVGSTGRASAWTAVTHTTQGATLGPNEVPVLSTTDIDSLTGRALLTWTPVPQADVSYSLQYSEDGGSTWTYEASPGNATSQYVFIPDGADRFYRVQAVTYAGVAGDWSNYVELISPTTPP